MPSGADGWRFDPLTETGYAVRRTYRWVQATDFGNLHDRGVFGPLDRPGVERILLQREVRSYALIVREVAGRDAAQVALVQDEDMVQTLAPD